MEVQSIAVTAIAVVVSVEIASLHHMDTYTAAIVFHRHHQINH
jgi:hypothetical protein